jgi:hypothetical protein
VTLICICLAVLPGACRKREAPRAAEPRAAEPKAAEPGAAEPGAAEPGAAEPGAAEPGPREAEPAPPPAIEPITPGELQVGTVAEVAAKLERTHYDAEALGLRQVRFSLRYRSKKDGVEAQVDGRWHSGGPPEVSLGEVSRKGVKLEPPGDDPEDLGQKLAWDRLKKKILKLVEGIGNGFLSRRIFDWKSVTGGEVKKKGDRLVLSFSQDKMGQVTVVVGEGYRVQKVTAVSPLGFSRSMSYQTEVVDGRNLVTSAVLEGKLKKKLHKRARQVMATLDGTRFEIAYGKVGRYLLPVKLHKVIPGTQDELELQFTYQEAKP